IYRVGQLKQISLSSADLETFGWCPFYKSILQECGVVLPLEGSRTLLAILRTFGASSVRRKSSHGNTRAFRNSSFALLYICRLIAFNRLICPSINPLLQGVVIASFTACKSRRSALANWARKGKSLVLTSSIHAMRR